MRVSLAWLQEWVGVPLAAAEMEQCLTMAGLEVDSCQPINQPVPSNVVAAHITALQPHPHSKRLTICSLDDGSGQLHQLVCAASNARVGLCAAYARVGASLKGRAIAAKTIGDVVSEGMLCSAEELGLAERSAGLLSLPTSLAAGTDVVDYLALDDTVMELELTPNRGDCLSLVGLSREICALRQLNFSPPAPATIKPHYQQKPVVQLQADTACTRYLARLVRGFTPAIKTPVWMQERLRRSGIASVNAMVDVMNYVMLEWGQPLHAFDYATVHGDLHVRYAADGESLRLLNGACIQLQPDDLLIADEQRALALAGIMGGADSAVTANTQELLIECAYFTPTAVAGHARRYGLQTEASYRFERGVDPEIQSTAMARACELLSTVAQLEFGELLECTTPHHRPQRPSIKLRYEAVNRCLGIDIDETEVLALLRRLQCQVQPLAGACWCVPPSCRFDLTQEVDLIEEIARLHGYDKIPGEQAGVPQRGRLQGGAERIRQSVDYLNHQDYSQIITYSFVDPQWNAALSEDNPPRLKNPISPTTAVMRSSLLPGLLQALLYNFNHYQTRIRLFESGSVFSVGDDQVQEQPGLAAVAYGSFYPQQWQQHNPENDFFLIKNELEQLLQPWQNDLQWRATNHCAYQRGQSADVYYGGQCLARVGRLNPVLEDEYKLPVGIYLFELLPPAFVLQATPFVFKPLAAYPPVRRDLAIIVDKAVSAERLVACVGAAAGEHLAQTVIFDVFLSATLGENKKSVALGLIFQDSCRTLAHREVDQLLSKVVASLGKEFNAQLRS